MSGFKFGGIAAFAFSVLSFGVPALAADSVHGPVKADIHKAGHAKIAPAKLPDGPKNQLNYKMATIHVEITNYDFPYGNEYQHGDVNYVLHSRKIGNTVSFDIPVYDGGVVTNQINNGLSSATHKKDVEYITDASFQDHGRIDLKTTYDDGSIPSTFDLIRNTFNVSLRPNVQVGHVVFIKNTAVYITQEIKYFNEVQ